MIKRSEVENLHLGVHPEFLRWAARQALLEGCTLRALLGGCAFRARQLRGRSASALRLNGGNALPCPLGG
jgi:hypothetical protein